MVAGPWTIYPRLPRILVPSRPPLLSRGLLASCRKKDTALAGSMFTNSSPSLPPNRVEIPMNRDCLFLRFGENGRKSLEQNLTPGVPGKKFDGTLAFLYSRRLVL